MDFLLCIVGDAGLSLPPSELELGARFMGVFAEREETDGETLRWDAPGGAVGEEGGSAVEAAVAIDMRFMLCERVSCSLFTC